MNSRARRPCTSVPPDPGPTAATPPMPASFEVVDGALSTEVRVFATVVTPGGTVDCRTSVEPCELILSTVAFDSPWDIRTELRFDPDGPLLADPTISVSPDTDLHDADTLTVRGAHYSPGARVAVAVCPADDPAACDQGELPTADGDRRFEADITGWADFSPPGATTPVDCRQAPGCEVVATDDVRGGAPVGRSRSVRPTRRGAATATRSSTDVDVTRDVVYRQTIDYLGNPIDLKLDIYRPAGDTATERPAIVWMYGGGFAFGDKHDDYISTSRPSPPSGATWASPSTTASVRAPRPTRSS